MFCKEEYIILKFFLLELKLISWNYFHEIFREIDFTKILLKQKILLVYFASNWPQFFFGKISTDLLEHLMFFWQINKCVDILWVMFCSFRDWFLRVQKTHRKTSFGGFGNQPWRNCSWYYRHDYYCVSSPGCVTFRLQNQNVKETEYIFFLSWNIVCTEFMMETSFYIKERKCQHKKRHNHDATIAILLLLRHATFI